MTGGGGTLTCRLPLAAECRRNCDAAAVVCMFTVGWCAPRAAINVDVGRHHRLVFQPGPGRYRDSCPTCIVVTRTGPQRRALGLGLRWAAVALSSGWSRTGHPHYRYRTVALPIVIGRKLDRPYTSMTRAAAAAAMVINDN